MSFKSKNTQQDSSYSELDEGIFDDIPPAGSSPSSAPAASPEAAPALSRPAVETSPFPLPGSSELAPVVPAQPAPMMEPTRAPAPTPNGSVPVMNGGSVQEPAAAGEPGFMSHYKTLRQVAQALREQQEPDLDALIPLVDKALAAYKGCKSRIDQVNALLSERLDQVEGSR